MMVYSYGGGSDHARVQGSLPGGGVQAQLAENSSDNVFFPFFSPQLSLHFYRGCSMVISKKTIIFQGFRGGPTLSRGGGGGPT